MSRWTICNNKSTISIFLHYGILREELEGTYQNNDPETIATLDEIFVQVEVINL